MKNFRFIWHGLWVAPYTLFRLIPQANRIIRNEQSTVEERFQMAWKIVNFMRRHFKTKTYVYGLENIPKEDGFVTYSNHQGKYDALCIFEAMDRHTSVLWERKQASRILSRQICSLIDAVKIDLQDPRDIVNAISKCTDIVNSGRNIIIFPEGGYTDNHNEMQDFNTGCFTVNLRTKCTIVPVVLYDAYKAMNTNHLGRVETQVHILPPIPYSEYEGLKKADIAELVKARIEKKLQELRAQSQDQIGIGADKILEYKK
ncbi:MAG: 1-acyl-sn-glycerol-3-phosphate acyltransferase [Agathobacter sp.]|uniref:lysophospholipid acyltransferase family protein n=1 Tax=Agathobacter sp. TaxID=2021311 RepID=UPI002588A713|nr:lysophospholipid acyltransferase family protein [Agathobacter sp.]MCR5678430.1 1-acyl-sn-glycerol-3-phosphate acyltransferase [Agathobacter sp.]